MKFSILHKLALSIVCLVLLCAGVVGGLFYTKTTDLLVEHALIDINREVKGAGDILRQIIRTHDEDVLILASTPPIQGVLRARDGGGVDEKDTTNYTQWVSRLETIFESYLQRKNKYLTIRFLDHQGHELVSVARDGSTIIRAKGEDLQNKASRTYVREAIELQSGDVYVSEINLKREFGKLVEPYQEVIRSATPVYDDRDGKLAGLVVITAEIGNELRSIQNRVQSKGRTKIYITNDHGGYLLHPDHSRAYGFDLGKRYRVQEDIPQLTKYYLPNNQNRQVTLLPNKIDKWRVVNFTKIPIDSHNRERFIAVIMTQNYDAIVSEQSDVLNDVTIWAFFLVLGGITVAVFLSVRITRPIKQMTQVVDDFTHQRSVAVNLPITLGDEIGVLARSFDSMIQQVQESQANLRELNENLEVQVAERTRSLVESEAQQRTILEAIADAVVTIDANGLITNFNPAAATMFGYQVGELVGQDVSLLMAEDEREAHMGYTKNSTLHFQRIINQARDLEGLRKDGSIFPLELNVAPLKSKNRRGFVGILRDITERKQAKQALIDAREEAETANQAKSQFLSSMSHELRTPMNAIIGFSQLMQIDTRHPLSESQTESVSEIFKAGKHLLELINEILDLAKIEAGHVDLSIEAVLLSEVIEESLQLVAPLAKKRGIEISLMRNNVEISSDRLSQQFKTVRADRTRLKQVFLNLLSNAIKYNSENGKLIIECHDTDNNKTRINVKDTGVGLSEEQQTHLFKPFERLDAEHSEIEGTGIGLVITKNIVELMGGRIGVNSQLGEGSTFWIELPDGAAKHVKENMQGDLQLIGGGNNMAEQKTVLYIEDNPANLRLVAQLLSLRPDIHMWSAHEPLLGLELAMEHKPDLILLDINLSGMNGFEVLEILRQREATRKTPIIAISANAMPRDIEKGLAAGFDNYIVKPIDVKVFLGAIESVLKNEM